MPRKAQDLYGLILRNKQKIADQSYESLREKAVQAVTEMMQYGEFVTELDLEDDDMPGLQKFTAEVRELGYYYCLIEVQNLEGKVLSYRLRISLAHLEKNDGQQDLSKIRLEN